MSVGDSDSGIVGMAWVFETEGKSRPVRESAESGE